MPRPVLSCSNNVVSNPPPPGAQEPNEEGAFTGISEAERNYHLLEKLPDNTLRMHRYKSAFHHTPFKKPAQASRKSTTVL